MSTPKRNVVAELKRLGLSDDLAFAAYTAFGRKAVHEITRNPYSLIAKYEEDIDWKALDRFAVKRGLESTGIERLTGGVLYALRRAAASGHVYCPRIPLLAESAQILGIEDLILVQSGLESLRESGLVVQEQPLDPQEGKGDWVYLINLHTAESGIAHYMGLLAHSPSNTHRRKNQEINFEEIEQSLGVRLAEAQREAIRLSMDDKILVITGGPGTGKTTILKATVALWAKMGKRIKLAAPTGRAAKRLSESTARDASTIHRLLEYNPEQRNFNRNGYRPLKVDLMVVDEASMIDTTLMAALLETLPPSAHLLLVGDVDQLPSVGPGFVLRDIIRSGLVSVITLSEIFRQRPGSLISDNAARINRGESPVLDSGGVEEGQDFFFIRKPTLQSTLETVVEMVTRRIPEQFGFTPMEEIQVLAPMIKGDVGVENLNMVLQRELNPQKEGVEQFGYRICTGDKVMQIRNDYDKDVFNGDIGIVTHVKSDPVLVKVDFGDKRIAYDRGDLSDLTLAYAITIHKSQGSEYPAVVIPLVTKHFPLLQRNVLYTAVSRGRNLVVLVGTTRAMEIAIANNKIRTRYTGLTQRLIRVWEKRRREN